jgi:transcriptional regulator
MFRCPPPTQVIGELDFLWCFLVRVPLDNLDILRRLGSSRQSRKEEDSMGEGASPSGLVQGTLDMLILRTLALEPMHGYGIGLRLEQISRGGLRVNAGSLFPAFRRLERDGEIAAEWRMTENGRRAKYYSLTRAGRKALANEGANWERLSAAISAIVRAV